MTELWDQKEAQRNGRCPKRGHMLQLMAPKRFGERGPKCGGRLFAPGQPFAPRSTTWPQERPLCLRGNTFAPGATSLPLVQSRCHWGNPKALGQPLRSWGNPKPWGNPFVPWATPKPCGNPFVPGATPRPCRHTLRSWGPPGTRGKGPGSRTRDRDQGRGTGTRDH